MSILGIVLSFIFGAAMGSFANVLIVRLYERTSILGRSRCPECRTQLRPHHLVPLLSWLWLRGRCAFCRQPIHVQYPLVELAGAILAAITFVRHPFLFFPSEFVSFSFEFVLLFLFLILVVFDLRWKLLPLELMIGAAAAFVVWGFFSNSLSWSALLIGMAVGFSFLGVQVLISRGAWMGSGDPWLGLLMGAALGWPRVGIALYLAYVVGGGILIFLLLFGLVKRRSRIPFAPILAGGTVLALWFGSTLETWIKMIV